MKKLKVLVVDDEYEKAQNISSIIYSSGVPVDCVEHVSTASAARLALRRTSFDLLLIDLNLPAAMGDPPVTDGGIQFYDMLAMDVAADFPPNILFITGREELASNGELEALKRGIQLCRYALANDNWKTLLNGKLANINTHFSRRKNQYPEVDVAIVTALRQPELNAVLRLPYQWQTLNVPGDSSNYHIGQILRDDGRKLSVLAVSAHRKGMPSSAALVSKVCTIFRPKHLVMLGICAGIQGKCNLGDVIVADPAWDWGSGKQAENPQKSPVFLAAPHQRPLNTHMSQLALEMSTKADVLSAIKNGWSNPTPAGVLKIRVGPMASGASVIANTDTIKGINTQHRELLAVEMEAYAVMAAAEYANGQPPIAIAIKSVCDFADPKKNDDWQEYASYTSAAFFDQMFTKGNLPVS